MTTLKTVSANEVKSFFLSVADDGYLGFEVATAVRYMKSLDELTIDFIRAQLLTYKPVPKYLEAFDLNQSGKAFWKAAYRWLEVLDDMASDMGDIYFDALEQGKTEEESKKLIDAAVESYQPTK